MRTPLALTFPWTGTKKASALVTDQDLKPGKWLYLLPHADDPESGYALDERLDPSLDETSAHDLGAVGRFMASSGYIPDLILGSRTTRARDMADGISVALKREPRFWTERAIHYGTAGEIIDSIRAVADEVHGILLISGAQRVRQLAMKLSRGYGPVHARATRRRMLSEFPGGALAALCLSIESWTDLAPKTGHVHAFVRPADLRPQDH